MELTCVLKRIFLLVLFVQLYSVSYSQRAVLKLKDGSYLKGDIIEETDQYIRFSILSGDTLFLGYKYVNDIISYGEYNSLNPDHNEEIEKYHRTKGIFTNIDLWGFPVAIEVGKRLTPSLNVGGRASFLTDDRTTIIGLETYVQRYFSKRQDRAKFYAEGHIGIGRRTEERRFFHSGNLNRYPFVGGAAIGVQIPNRKRIKIYFEIGISAVQEVNTFILNDQFLTEITERELHILPHVTLIGLQF